MKISEIDNRSREELRGSLEDLREKLLKLSFDLADNKIKDFSQFKKVKKDIARVLTVMNKPNINKK